MRSIFGAVPDPWMIVVPAVRPSTNVVEVGPVVVMTRTAAKVPVAAMVCVPAVGPRTKLVDVPGTVVTIALWNR
jgi:hypothetical protein